MGAALAQVGNIMLAVLTSELASIILRQATACTMCIAHSLPVLLHHIAPITGKELTNYRLRCESTSTNNTCMLLLRLDQSAAAHYMYFYEFETAPGLQVIHSGVPQAMLEQDTAT